MALYAIGDLHLSLAVNKSMEVFGPAWENYVSRIESSLSQLTAEDVLILAGDTSWGMSLGEAEADFRFLEQFPCKKLLIKGNHDYWWSTVSKMSATGVRIGSMEIKAPGALVSSSKIGGTKLLSFISPVSSVAGFQWQTLPSARSLKKKESINFTVSSIAMPPTTIPTRIIRPTSTFMIPAAARGPEVGGTQECVITPPAVSAATTRKIGFFISLAIAIARGARRMNVTS